jgi:hypothetical protein
MRSHLGSLLTSVAVLLACKPAVETIDNIDRWKVADTDPVLAVGHGAILDSRGREVDPSPEFVIKAQRFYLHRLNAAASEKQRAELKSLYQHLAEAKPATEAEQIIVNAAVIQWLIGATRPDDLAHLASKNTALLSRYFGGLEQPENVNDQRAGRIRRALLERLKATGMLQFLSATTAGGADYLAECREAGVPIPPDWGTPTWRSLGMLSTEFISAALDAEVFAFESDSPRGVCFALPRSSGGTIELLGIICLGTQSSKSCYWDNQRGKRQFDIPKNTVVPLSDFAGGADLFQGSGGVCTDCHAGENPFVVHPGEPMDLGARITPAGWPAPLVHPSWPQNQGPNSVLPGVTLGANDLSCLNCHVRPPGRRFPEVSTDLPAYCGTILPSAISRTMPSAGNPASYAKHIDGLRTACRQPPPSGGGVVINGATQSAPGAGRVDDSGDLSACTAGGDCPLGYCYWRTLHGPFWQITPASVPVGDPAYRGSFLQIYAAGGRWKWRAFSDPTGLPPNAPPGGTAECVRYNEIATVPDPNSCFANQFAVADPDGTQLAQSIDATVLGSTVNVLSGFIGNVAQSNLRRPDMLRVWENVGRVQLDQNHSATPPVNYPPGPLRGESWTNGCNAWTPVYAARDVFTDADAQLVPPAQANDVRCFVTGITGAWSSTRSNATVQPFAEIYRGPTADIRLRVSPSGGEDGVGAFASCISLR